MVFPGICRPRRGGRFAADVSYDAGGIGGRGDAKSGMAAGQSYPSLEALRKLEASRNEQLREQGAWTQDDEIRRASSSRLICETSSHGRMRLRAWCPPLRKFLFVGGTLGGPRHACARRALVALARAQSVFPGPSGTRFLLVPVVRGAIVRCMSCRKREIAPRMENRDFPHLVELVLPPGGLGEGDLAIAAFHKERRIAARFGNVGHNDGEFCVTLCFADSADADAFQRRFGGTRRVRGTREAMQYLPGAEARWVT
jgi:hypothetical protein